MKINWRTFIYNPFLGAIVLPLGFASSFGLFQLMHPAEGLLSTTAFFITLGLSFLITALILIAINFVHFETDNKSLKVCLLISVEDGEHDKYISSDFKDHMDEIYKADGMNVKVVVPNYFFRKHLVKRIIQYNQTGKSFFETADWQFIQRHMLKSQVFFLGEIKARTSNGSDKFILSKQHMVVVCPENASKEAIDHLKNCLGAETFKNNQIDRHYEEEHITDMSMFFVNLTEYLVGIIRLINSEFLNAYNLHIKLYKKTTPKKRSNIYKDLEPCLNEEINALVIGRIRLGFIDEAKAILDSHASVCPDNYVIAVLKAHWLICSSQNEIQCKQNAKVALKVLSESQKGSKNVDNALLLLNRAYLHLILEHYSEANKNYRAANKYAAAIHFVSILGYCNFVLGQKERTFEHKTAEFVKAYALYKLHCFDDVIPVLTLVFEHNDKDSFYYKEATKMMSALPKK